MKWMGDVMSRDGMNGRKRPDERLVSGAYQGGLNSALLLSKLLERRQKGIRKNFGKNKRRTTFKSELKWHHRVQSIPAWLDVVADTQAHSEFNASGIYQQLSWSKQCGAV